MTRRTSEASSSCIHVISTPETLQARCQLVREKAPTLEGAFFTYDSVRYFLTVYLTRTDLPLLKTTVSV